MIYKFVMLSDEVDNFVREIAIDAEATFFDLHNAILDSVGFVKDQMTSFFLCNEDWEKKEEITLIEMNVGSEYDNYVMEDSVLSDFVSEEDQKLLYVFDNISDRVFFLELKEITDGKNLKKPVVALSIGEAPQQVTIDDDFANILKDDFDENFYGDEDYDINELDEDGFEMDINSFDDDLRF